MQCIMNNKVRVNDKLKRQVKLQDMVLQYYHMTIFSSHLVRQMRNKITRVITFRWIIQDALVDCHATDGPPGLSVAILYTHAFVVPYINKSLW